MAGYREPAETNGVGSPAPSTIPGAWQPSGPKPTQSGSSPAWLDYGVTEPGNSKAIPLAYGRVKITTALLEHGAPKSSTPVVWYASQQYGVGAFSYANGNTYQVIANTGDCRSAGSGTGPSGTDSSIVDNNVTWKYVQSGQAALWASIVVLGLCEGPIGSISKLWWDQETYNDPGAKDLIVCLGSGNANLDSSVWPPPWLYQTIALLASPSAGGTRTGTAKELPSTIAAEVNAVTFADGLGVDVNAADVVNDILTHARRGVGWPGSRIADLTPYRTYVNAAGLRFSLLVDSQRTALDILSQILLATNSDAIWSQGQVKIVPRGDTAITSPVFGATTYTPNNVAAAALGKDDFLGPIQIQRRSEADSYNDCPVTYLSRADDYSEQPVSDPDVADIQRRQLAGAPNSGKNSAQPTSLGLVLAPDPVTGGASSATMLSRLWAQRGTQCRNTYTFKIGWRFLALEPTDVVTISDPVMDISNVPVRILAIEEEIGSSGEGVLTITAEDWPAGVATAARWAPQAGDGYSPNLVGAAASGAPVSPGDVQAAQAAAAAAQSTATTAQSAAAAAQTDATAAKNTAPITAARLTSPPNDNIWPNGMNVLGAAPAGADATKPEWAALFASATSYRGSGYVRRLTGSAVRLGDIAGTQYISESTLGLNQPASPGDQFYMEAMVRTVSGNATDGAGVYLTFFDNAGTAIAGTPWQTIGAPPNNTAAWMKAYVSSIPAPAGTASVNLICYKYSEAGATIVEFDSIYVRRAVAAGALAVNSLQTTNYAQDGSGNPTAGARLSNDPADTALKVAPGQFKLGTWLFDDGANAAFWTRLKNALDNYNPDGQGNRTFYAGSTAHGGTPDIGALTAYTQEWTTIYLPSASGGTGTYAKTLIDNVYTITASSLSQNLDSLRYLDLWWCNNQNQGIVNTYINIPDRPHGNQATINVSYTHLINGSYQSGHNGGAGSFLYFKARLFNVYGHSAEKYFQAPGTALWTTWEYGLPPFGSPSTGGGGGSGGGGCPAPWVKVQLDSGLWVPAGTLADGMKVRAFDEHDSRIVGAIGTVRHPRQLMKERFDIALSNGKVTSFSHDHKMIVDGTGWKRVRDLRPGDSLPQVDGPPLIVKTTKSIGLAPIIDFAVEGARTYFADGFAHNTLKN